MGKNCWSGKLPKVSDLQKYVDNRIAKFESELNVKLFDLPNEVIRARIVELKNLKIIVDGVTLNEQQKRRKINIVE
jgi:hypothetical protein